MRILQIISWLAAITVAALIGRSIGLHMYFWGWGAFTLLALTVFIIMGARNMFGDDHFDLGRLLCATALWLGAGAIYLGPLIRPLLQ